MSSDYKTYLSVLLDKTHRIIGQIGSGAFGQIFEAEDKFTGRHVAIKLEHTKYGNGGVLPYEYSVYQNLKRTGVPLVHNVIKFNQFNVLILELLGPSLEQLFVLCGQRFSVKTVLMLANQMLKLVRFMHLNNYIHRDIKPDNFLMGKGKKKQMVHIIDFGLVCKYQKRLTTQKRSALIGTARYASINAHLGVQLSRRDDLESLSYVLIYFLRGKLPWQGLPSQVEKQKFEMIAELKQSIKLEDLCKDLPLEFGAFLQHCRDLKYDQEPDYIGILNSFSALYRQSNYPPDGIYDWTNLLLTN